MDRSRRPPSRRVGACVALALLLTTVVDPASAGRGVHMHSARQSVLQLSGAIGRITAVRSSRSTIIVPSVDQGEVRDKRDLPPRDAVLVRAFRAMPSRPARLPAPPLVAGAPQHLRI